VIGRVYLATALLGLALHVQGAEPAQDHSEHQHSAETIDHPAHMGGDPLRGMLLADRLEWQGDASSSRAAWDVIGWLGKDDGRLWVRAEGERADGSTQSSAVEAFWGRPVGRWWDLLVGLRHDFQPGDARSWIGAGVYGVAPYEFDVRLTAYVGEGGATQLHADVERDLLITQRLVLQPRFEARLFGKNDLARGQSSGLSETALGLRLRYEIRRELAPYVGVEWGREAGGRESRLSALAGVRAWF
jgi:copper resistance protein B